MDHEILLHVQEAQRHLRAAENRYRFVRECNLPPLIERVLLDEAATAVENFLASPHSERDA